MWVRFYRWGVGFRAGSHYWHLRRDPLDLYSERYRIRCSWWQMGRWRLTHRWNVGDVAACALPSSGEPMRPEYF